MGLGAVEYYEQSRAALELADFGVGLVKGSVFGVMVALAGCYHGIRCGRSSAAVGAATTAAVVTGIVLIVSACGLFAVTFYLLGI
jgi:phospholipid/cholesterol/gamma-HCH transport system permease protein